MIIFYYSILGFGILLLSYTALTWNKTRRRIHARENHDNNRFKRILEVVREKFILWLFYFTGGEKKNLFRSIIISFVVFLTLYYINLFYIRIDNKVFILGFFSLFFLLIWKLGQHKNRKMFEEKFPEIIQVINSATSSGSGLLQALDRCGKDITGQLGEEFRNIYRRLSIGEEPMSVFTDSYSRYPYKEFYFFITIIRTNLTKGGQMKEVISRLGRVIADSKKMEQKKKAMTSEARMSAMIVASFPIAFFFFMKVTMPENFDYLINNPSGRVILYYVIGSELLGMFIIWWLMRKST
ncbi:type II secretion system F family protein [Glaesserella sp.]|uniref:type II secretion system F family protein n=1 Tax=Glaesserella sp. TaxID=2094731 RepID=UPI00359FD7D7